MNESHIGLLLISGATLWLLGGSGVTPFRKGWRRFIWPITCGGLLLWSGTPIVTALLTSSALMGVCSLGYGDSTPYPVRVLVFFLLPAPALILNLWAFPFVLLFGALITGFDWLTKKYNFFTHKILEGLAGFSQAAAIIIASLMP